MRKLALLLALVLLPTQVWALSTSDLLSLIAMPLAVAAVSNTAGVSSDRLANLVASLNQANVPPTQFVEVIRYVPVALVVQNNQQPDFVQYVNNEVAQGVTGDALVNAMVQQLQSTYSVTPQMTLLAPATTVVVQQDYIPTVVQTQLGLAPNDVVAAALMPLAVAAVSNVAGVPQDQLANLVAALNNANVPPAQIIEVVRYSPPALIVDNGQPFVQFVQQQTSQGVTGPALVPVVVQQLQTYYPAQTQIVVNQPQRERREVEVDEEHFVPPMVLSRVAEAQGNPHGGPPGQIKKQIGVQTGAEVVHGEKPGRQFTPAPVAVVPAPHPGRGHGRGHAEGMPQPMMSSSPAPVPVEHGRGRGHEGGHEGGPPMVAAPAPAPVPVPAATPAPAPQRVPPGQAKEHGNGDGKSHGHGKD